MKKAILAGIIFLLVFCFTCNAWSAFRCKSLLIGEGVDSARVFVNCGEPVYKENLPYMDSYVEKWIYGPLAGYYYVLYFESGKCIKIEEKRQGGF